MFLQHPVVNFVYSYSSSPIPKAMGGHRRAM